jgi:hypothetical protein
LVKETKMFTAQWIEIDNQLADVDQLLSVAAPGGLTGDHECGNSDTGSNSFNAVVVQQPQQAMQPPQEKKNREYIKAAQIPNKNRCASND